MRPGREVGEGLAGDLFGGEAEEVLGVVVPGADAADPVDLDDGDADAGVGEREGVGGQGRAGGAGAGRAGGQVELEPDLFVGGGVFDAPAGGEGRAEQQAAAAFPVDAAELAAGALQRKFTFGVVVADLYAHAGVRAEAQDVGGGAGVYDGVGDEFAGQDDGIVHDVGESPALEGVPDKRAGGGDRASDRLEGGGSPRGDHSTPHWPLVAPPESCARFASPRFVRQAKPSAEVVWNGGRVFWGW